MVILLSVIFVFICGVFAGVFISKLVGHKNKYSGDIVVTKTNEGRTLYSLELNDYPEKIEFKKEVIFKVLAPDDESSRE